MKFHDQHKWLRRISGMKTKIWLLRVYGVTKNPVCLLCQNANFTAWYSESCGFGAQIYCDGNKNSIFSSFVVMVRRRKTLPVCFSETKQEKHRTHQNLKGTNSSVVNLVSENHLRFCFFLLLLNPRSCLRLEGGETGAIVDGAEMTAPVSSERRQEFSTINP